MKVDTLPIHILGSINDSAAVYEQLFANCKKITIRYLDALGDAKFIAAPLQMLQQIGFGEDETLFERDDRVLFRFRIAARFLRVPEQVPGLQAARACASCWRRSTRRLSTYFSSAVRRRPGWRPIVNPGMFSLYTVPAVNLFEMSCSRVPVRRGEHEHHVVPDRSRVLEFEAHRIIDVFAHYPSQKEKVRVYPLYSLPGDNVRASDAMYYTMRRLPRRRSSREQRVGAQSSYAGSEIFLSLSEPAGVDDTQRVRELSVRCLASNRHLADQLPVGEAGADFFLIDDTSVPLHCVAGPTKPKESLVAMERKRIDTSPFGATAWKLINFLSLSHLGLIDRDQKDRAGALRELLALFSDLSEIVSEQRMRGIEGITSRPIVRRLRQKNGFNAARGIEITVRLDEKAFEGIGIFLLGAVLDRFFAEYTSLNSFTETVIESKQRGLVKRWPPRTGTGQAL